MNRLNGNGRRISPVGGASSRCDASLSALPALAYSDGVSAGPSRLGRLADQARRFVHDFRNLLLVAEARVELAQIDAAQHPGAVESLNAARSALAEVREMTRLLDDLTLDNPPQSQLVNLVDVVRETVRALGGALPLTIQLVEDFQIEPPLWVHGDAAQISRLIRNLVLNARDAMPEGGRLTVSLDPIVPSECSVAGDPSGEVRLVVADTGTGMSAATRARIFEPFFTTKAGRGGTGLGLPIVREIADAHAARIEVDSAPGRGTQVCVTFPAVASAQAAEEMPAGCARSALGKVLVVGNDERLRSMATGSLCGSGTLVGFADTGREALRVLERERGAVRCLVVDVATLPADEVALLRALRCWRGRRGLVMLLPAEAPRRNPVAGRGECVVSRPLVFGELERSVRRALEIAN